MKIITLKNKFLRLPSILSASGEGDSVFDEELENLNSYLKHNIEPEDEINNAFHRTIVLRLERFKPKQDIYVYLAHYPAFCDKYKGYIQVSQQSSLLVQK